MKEKRTHWYLRWIAAALDCVSIVLALVLPSFYVPGAFAGYIQSMQQTVYDVLPTYTGLVDRMAGGRMYLFDLSRYLAFVGDVRVYNASGSGTGNQILAIGSAVCFLAVLVLLAVAVVMILLKRRTNLNFVVLCSSGVLFVLVCVYMGIQSVSYDQVLGASALFLPTLWGLLAFVLPIVAFFLFRKSRNLERRREQEQEEAVQSAQTAPEPDDTVLYEPNLFGYGSVGIHPAVREPEPPEPTSVHPEPSLWVSQELVQADNESGASQEPLVRSLASNEPDETPTEPEQECAESVEPADDAQERLWQSTEPETPEPDADQPVTCPQCGMSLKPGSKFCPHCGAHLSPESHPVCPQCGAPMKPDSRFCTKCGHKIS